MTACDDCLRRTDLIAAMAGRLQIEFKRRSAPARVLALHDEDLLELARGSRDPAPIRGLRRGRRARSRDGRRPDDDLRVP